MCVAQSVFASSVLGGCSPGLFTQRSTSSMTFWWLGRTGFGAPISSESLRGNLTSSVMASLPLKGNAPARDSFHVNILIFLDIFTQLAIFATLMELTAFSSIE